MILGKQTYRATRARAWSYELPQMFPMGRRGPSDSTGMGLGRRQPTLLAGPNRAWLACCAAALAVFSTGSATAQLPAKPSDAEICLAANASLSLGTALPRTTARLNAGAALSPPSAEARYTSRLSPRSR